MKTQILLLLVISFILFGCTQPEAPIEEEQEEIPIPEPSPPVCNDGDGGINLDEKGECGGYYPEDG